MLGIAAHRRISTLGLERGAANTSEPIRLCVPSGAGRVPGDGRGDHYEPTLGADCLAAESCRWAVRIFTLDQEIEGPNPSPLSRTSNRLL